MTVPVVVTLADRVLARLVAGPASVQALAAHLGAPVPDVRREVLSLATAGRLEGNGRGEGGAMTWRRVAPSDPDAPPPKRAPHRPNMGGKRSAKVPTPARPRAVDPLRPAVRRYVRWFQAARWPTREIARLFNLDPADVAAVPAGAHP